MSLARSTLPLRSGFTLIELLVVISIIALLIAILLPVLGRAKSAGQSTLCLNHQRQLVLATIGYGHDNRGYLPQPSEDEDLPAMGPLSGPQVRNRALWFNAVDYYLQQRVLNYNSNAANRNYNVFKQDPVWQGYAAADRDVTRTIKMNAFLGDINDDLANNPSDWKFFREQDIPRPAATVLYFDGRSIDTPAVNTGAVDAIGSAAFSGEELMVGLRHLSRSANVSFVNGHGQNVAQEIRTSPGANEYQGWFAGPTATPAAAAGPQKLNWFHLGRNNVFDN